jgi:maleylacetate reductase
LTKRSRCIHATASTTPASGPATEAAQQSIASLGTPGSDVSEAFAFIVELDLPRRPADVGVSEDRQERDALDFTRANPQPIRMPADILKILRLA